MPMIRKFINDVFHLYVDGFRQMTWGRSLWLIVVVKLILIFAVLKLFFFPDFIGTHRGHQSASDFVSRQVLPPDGSRQELPTEQK